MCAYREERHDPALVEVVYHRRTIAVAVGQTQAVERLLLFFSLIANCKSTAIVAVPTAHKRVSGRIVIAVCLLGVKTMLAIVFEMVDGFVEGGESHDGLHGVAEAVGDTQPPVDGGTGKELVKAEAGVGRGKVEGFGFEPLQLQLGCGLQYVYVGRAGKALPLVVGKDGDAYSVRPLLLDGEGDMGEAMVEAQVAEHDDVFTAVDEQHGRNLFS